MTSVSCAADSVAHNEKTIVARKVLICVQRVQKLLLSTPFFPLDI